MKTTIQILDVLRCSYRAYDNYRHKEFILWCENIAEKYRMSIRVLSRHDGLMNWHQDMWQIHVEKKFLLENRDYILANIMDEDTADDLIHDYAMEIQFMEPQVLLRLIQMEQQIEIPTLL